MQHRPGKGRRQYLNALLHLCEKENKVLAC
jgi:hypothetical protein